MAMNSRSNLVLVYVLLGVALGATYAVGGILFDNYTMRPEPLPLGELQATATAANSQENSFASTASPTSPAPTPKVRSTLACCR